jgi:hypothetical protein
MAFLQQLADSELKALVKTIQPGKFMFIYESPDRWGVEKAMSKPHQPTSHTIVIVDIGYSAPGWETRPEITECDERASGIVVNTWGLQAVYDTREEADAVAERMVSLIAVYQEEIAAPLLKLEMGLSVLLECD